MNKDELILIDIPYSPCQLFIYTGSGRLDFVSRVQKLCPEINYIDDATSDGMNWMNNIYIEDMTDINVLIHEVSHFLDWLFTEMMIQEEGEFKANIMAHVFTELFERKELK